MHGKEIIAAWLKENGYDGLYEPGECACLVNEIAPCDSEAVLCCQAGYLTDPPPGWEKDNFFIGPEKQKGDKQ